MMKLVSHLSGKVVLLAYRAVSRFDNHYYVSVNMLENIADRVSNGDPTWVKLRDFYFAPFANILLKLGITPNSVSLLGLVFAVWAAVISSSLFVFTLLIMLNLACDGIDGVMARKSNSDSDIGSIIDITCDTLSVIVVAAGLMVSGQISFYVGVPYMVTVVLYTARSAVKNKLLRETFLSVGSRIMAFSGLILMAPILAIFQDEHSNVHAVSYLFAIMTGMMLLAYAADIIKTKK